MLRIVRKGPRSRVLLGRRLSSSGYSLLNCLNNRHAGFNIKGLHEKEMQRQSIVVICLFTDKSSGLGGFNAKLSIWETSLPGN